MTNTEPEIGEIPYSRNYVYYMADKLVDQIPPNSFSEIKEHPNYYWETQK